MYDVLYIGDTVEYFVVIKKITRACARFFISIGAHIGTYMSLNQTDAPEKTKRVDDSLRGDYIRIANDFRKTLGLPPFIDKK